MNFPHAFRRICVDTHASVLTEQRATISWAMQPDFDAPGPWTFTLQRGLAPTDDAWEDIATTVDQPWLYDNRPITNTIGIAIFYRIKLVDGKGVVYYSQAQEIKAYWSRYDWTLAKEITRKERFLMQTRTGVKGWLLKRKYFGDPCPLCLDPVTGQVIDPNCTDCFGTGIVGGYYEPYTFWLTMNGSQKTKKLTPDQGTTATNLEVVRALAYPSVEPNDVWVHGYTNTRYFIEPDIKVLARHRGIDLVMEYTLLEVPTKHPVYLVPIPCPNLPGSEPAQT